MATALTNLVTAHDDRIVFLWQPNDPIEQAALRAHAMTGFSLYGIVKLDTQLFGWVETRTGLDKRWKVLCHGYIITSYDTEAEADTFIRKLKDQINTTDGTNTVKRCADL
jgi:hypothetical protein